MLTLIRRAETTAAPNPIHTISHTMLSYDSVGPVKGQDSTASVTLPSGVPKAAVASNTNLTVNTSTEKNHMHTYNHIWLVTGPAGCGKTTVAEYLAGALEMPYIEGDSVCKTLPRPHAGV